MAASTPPSDLGVGRERALRERLSARARPDGFVPFDRFMELALYGEGVGFYSRGPSPLGPKGHYYTAAHVHPLFGETIAERILSVRRALGPGRPFRVVEIGPGDGTLASVVLSALGRALDGGHSIEYLLVERSASLGTRALERVTASAEAAGISARLAAGVGADGPFEGFVLANEVLDAQPTRRLRWNGHEWRELGVRVVEDRLVSAEGPLASPVPRPDLPVPAEPGVVLEVSPMAEALVREVADHLARGEAAFFDYGLDESELLAAHPRGTLARVHHHASFDDPLEDPGASDLSAFVNFSRVRAAARAAGLEEIAYRSQSEALGAWGFPRLLDRAVRAAGSAEAEVRVRMAAKNLLFGFDRFRVLELAAPAGDGGWRRTT